MNKSMMRLIWILMAVAAAPAVLSGCAGSVEEAATIPVLPDVDVEQVLSWNNIGVGYLERHRYGKAEEFFKQAVEKAPDWSVGHINLGIALMNLRRNDEALVEFNRGLELDPDNPNAAYCKGLIYRNQGESDLAITAFERLIARGVEDSDLFYNLGLLHFREKRSQRAADLLRRAIDLDQYNASAQFKLASVLMDIGEKEEAERWMNRFRVISDAGMGRTAGQQYTEQGRYADAISTYGGAAVDRAVALEHGMVFADVAGAAGIAFRHGGPGGLAPGAGATGEDALRRLGSGAAWIDYDADGDPDLYLSNLGGPNALYRNRGDGTFEEVAAAAGVAEAGESMAAYFGDYDNDRLPDLFVANLGPDRLYRNRGDGTFEDVTATTGVGHAGASIGAAWADIDHDGDIDIYVTTAEPASDAGALGGVSNRLFRNNGNGTFTERAAEVGIDGGRKQGLGVVFSDFDNDRDIDLLFWSDGAPVELQSNLREDKWLDLARDVGLPTGEWVLGVVPADFNKDGWFDLVFTGRGHPAVILLSDHCRSFTPDPAAEPILAATGGWNAAVGAQVADFDNDGFLDLLITGEDERGGGTALMLRNRGRDGWEDITGSSGIAAGIPPAPRGVALADFDADGDADILVSSNGGPAALLQNRGGERNLSLQVVTRGLNSNRNGIGTKVEIQAGGLWQKQEVLGGCGFLSQNDPQLNFGLGDRTQADFVRLLWPGGVLQAELEKPAGEPVVIEELDRKGSSCPTLFAWTGERYEFVTDLIGVGGIGFLVQPWTYSHPDPTEYIKLDPIRIRPHEGKYRLSVVGQLEEAVYLDAVRLIAVDHPDGTDIFPDERFALGPDRPSGKIHRVRDRYFPDGVRDHRGREVRDRILRVDRRYADGFELLKFPGYAEPHGLEMEFRGLPASDRWVLYLYGWVDYEYSSSTLAAWQAGVDLQPPVLEMLDRDGKILQTYPEMGFPAGMPKMMTFELPDPLPAGTVRFRLTTNMRIYWDQIFLAPAVEVPVRVTRLPASEARLRHLGFPREFSPDGAQPLIYDYHLPGIGFPWKSMAGHFTRFGEVTELVEAADDQFVIMGHGEEVRLGFDPDGLPQVPDGWRRSFLFFADGFCKDMDPNTALPDTVEPLPFHAMSAYPYLPGEHYPDDAEHREYRRIWNTRRVGAP